MFKNKKNLIFILASFVVFILLAVLYANPVISGKRLMQHDIVFYKGGAEELLQYRANNDKETYWSDAMFGGMPTYQTGAQFRGDVIKKIDDLFLFLPKPANYLFLLFAGFFFLGMVAVRNWKYALLGATFFGLSTYFYIIIAAGHNGKVHTIAYFAPLVAGILLVYFRKKYILGFITTTLFMGLQICANHPQMTYYLFIGLGFLFLSELIRAIKGKIEWKHFLISTGILAVAGIIGVGMNSQRIMANAEYVKETVRGKQILNDKNHTAGKSGMDKESITMWSYGKLETLNLFIPRLMGGASQEEGSDKIMAHIQELAQENIKSQQEYDMMTRGFGSPTYWGDQPSTSGPAYQGAVVCFLAVLGFFFAGKRYRYWILGASTLTIFLAWGSNFSVLTDFFIDYVPLYNKFRAPSSILVVVEFLFPLIAMIGLYKFFTDEKLTEKYKKGVLSFTSIFIISLTLVLVVSPQIGPKFITIVTFLGLLFLLVRRIFNINLFTNNRKFDILILTLLIITTLVIRFSWDTLSIDFYTYKEKTYLPPFLLDYLVDERASMFRTDAFKAIIYVLITAGALFLGLKKKLNVNIVLLIIGFVSLFDLWTVNRRYLNDDNYVDKTFADYPFQTENSEYLMSKAGDNSFVQSLLQQTEVNKALQTISEKDKDHYRIFNNILSTFSETNTSYFKSSIGGYHAVKLRRYDDLINKYFSTTDQIKTVRILNMLNTKYFLVGDQQKPEITPNPEANGNAWFVSDIKYVDNPNEELNETGNLDTKKIAVISKDDKAYFNGKNMVKDSTAFLALKSYQPNELSFDSSSKTPQLAVFSEVYYPHGWNVYLDGNKVDYIKANYLLRALYVPAGKHKIEMKFEPAVIETGKLFSLISFGLFVLLSLVGVYFLFKDFRKSEVAEA